jgi:hypothetical protein
VDDLDSIFYRARIFPYITTPRTAREPTKSYPVGTVESQRKRGTGCSHTHRLRKLEMHVYTATCFDWCSGDLGILLLLCNTKTCYRTQNTPPLEPILIQTNLVSIFTFCLFNIHFNITFPHGLYLPILSSLHNFLPTYLYIVTYRPIARQRLGKDIPANPYAWQYIWWSIQIIKSSFCSLPGYCYFLPSVQTISLSFYSYMSKNNY